MMDADLPDAFAPFYRTAHQAQSWRRWCWGLGGLVALQAVAIATLALRPPWVIVKDRIDGTPPAVQRMLDDPPLNLADVRLFFGHMARLRFGWQSTTLMRDLEAFLLQCHPVHRAAQLRHLQASDAAPGEGGEGPQSRLRSRLQAWSQADIANHLVLPERSEDIHCRLRPQHPIWDCSMAATLLADSASRTGSDSPVAATMAQKGAVVASFIEVPHTQKTPYGLLVTHIDFVAAQAAELPAHGAEQRQGEVP